jgi:two-component sensor histidine kinase/ligand-binding sensor domain-containing protein
MIKISLIICFLFITQLNLVGQNSIITKDYIIENEFLTEENGLPSKDIYCGVQDKKGFIWFGSKNGLCRYDGKNFKYFTTKDGLQSNIVVNLYVDNLNRIFISYAKQWSMIPISNNYDVLNAATFDITTYEKFLEKNVKPKLPPTFLKYQGENFSRDILDKNKTILFFKNQGIKMGDPEKVNKYIFDGNKQILASPEGIFILENKKIYKILESSVLGIYGYNTFWDFFKDAQNNLWLCTQKGVYKLTIKPNYFKTYFTSDELKQNQDVQARGISVNTTDGRTTIIAYVGVFFLKSSNKTETINTIPTTSWGVIQIKDQLYLSSPNKLNIFQAKSSKLLYSVSLPFKKNGNVNCMFQKNESTLLLGRNEDILIFDLNNHANYSLSYKSAQLPKVKNVYRIFNSSKGIIVQAENGLFLIQNKQIVDYFGPLAKDKKKYLPIKCMLDAYEDKNQNVWIATNGQGLFKWQWNQPIGAAKIENFTSVDGLQCMLLYRIEEDDDNNLWISSDNGLIRFNKSNRTFDLFTTKDGLSNYEFNRGSSFKAKDGQIYFGSIDGVVGFNPTQIKINKIKEAPFQLLSLIKYGNEGEKELVSSFLKSNRIELYDSDKLVRIEFVLLDYSSKTKNYAYRIKGVQDNWISITSRSISIGKLPPGDYILEIKAQLEDGTWHKQILKVSIFVIPPFYLTTWFLSLTSLILLGLVLIIIWYRSKRLKMQNSKLETIIVERTENLQIALGDKDILLKELHHRVKNNLQIITGLLELQKEQLTDETAIAALNEGQIRLTSIALIHQHFYFGSDLEKISFNSFLLNLITHVKQLLESENRVFECVINPSETTIEIDNAIPLGLIVNELLTNSFKYLPVDLLEKRIEINLQVLENGMYELIYKDNGPGLPPSINFDNSQTLGLKLIRGLSQQIKGSVTYHYDNGSVFMIRFKGKSKKSLN